MFGKKDKAEKTPDEIIEETIDNGGVLAILYFDMHGSSPDTIKNIMVDFVSRLTKEPGVVFAYGEIESPIELDDNMYSTSVEVRALTRDVPTLVRLCLKYVPVGVEVIKPTTVTLDLAQFHKILTDISSYALEMMQIAIAKGMTDEQKRELARRLKKREEIGKRLLEKHREPGDTGENDS